MHKVAASYASCYFSSPPPPILQSTCPSRPGRAGTSQDRGGDRGGGEEGGARAENAKKHLISPFVIFGSSLAIFETRGAKPPTTEHQCVCPAKSCSASAKRKQKRAVGLHSGSTSENCVGSSPTGVICHAAPPASRLSVKECLNVNSKTSRSTIQGLISGSFTSTSQKHLWSSGYDVSPTRFRSPVRSWPGVWQLGFLERIAIIHISRS